MSEGGLLPWKIQKIQRPQNGVTSTCRYSDIKGPLPDPPKGKVWMLNENTREWKLVDVVTNVESRDEATAAAVPTVAVDSTDESCKEGAHASAASVVATLPPLEEVACVAVPVLNIGTFHENRPRASGRSSIEHASRTIHNMQAGSSGPSGTINVGIMDETTGVTTKYKYHTIQPTDTFQGICLKYQITPLELRRANSLLGDNLKLAPERLVIPPSKKKKGGINGNHGVRKPTEEEIIASLLVQFSQELSYSEARAYLEVNDWDLDKAAENARDDLGWSSQHPANQLSSQQSMPLEIE